jgi:RHS repeat-associated protein
VEFVPVGEEGETEARTTEFSVFYFAGRPVAQVKELDSATERVFLTTDHLGTPLLATNLSGNDHWAGPLEPFGKDFFQLAQSSDVFLRLPGQWDDPIWQNPTAGAGIYYNVHRWYETGTARYITKDPVASLLVSAGLPPLGGGRLDEYLYVRQRPSFLKDPLGLLPILGPTPSDPCSFYEQICDGAGCNCACNAGQKYCRTLGSLLNIFDSPETKTCIRDCLIDHYGFAFNGPGLPGPGCDPCQTCENDSRCIPKVCLAKQHKYCFTRCDSNSWWPGTFPTGGLFPTPGC